MIVWESGLSNRRKNGRKREEEPDTKTFIRVVYPITQKIPHTVT